MKFPVYSIGILLATMSSVAACGETKKDSLPAQQIEVVKIHEVEEEIEEEPPPPPAFDLTGFNIFVLDNESVYYYYDPAFQVKKELDEYRFENIKEAYLHKSSYKDLKRVLNKLAWEKALPQKRVVLAVKNNDSTIVGQVTRETLAPLGIDQVRVGFVSKELESLLTKKQ